ncbi:hypothetical protein H5410_000927 [Solanum commersonii]|uniref:Uncharacterized protein n=1 Tax=Solanum commersonii TaxID=4109 RepID=A0A9J6AY52_SOLCO|nr:hypothetical protein H5410_000927 [Solanum commersonii]
MTREYRSRYPLGAQGVKPPLLCHSSQTTQERARNNKKIRVFRLEEKLECKDRDIPTRRLHRRKASSPEKTRILCRFSSSRIEFSGLFEIGGPKSKRSLLLRLGISTQLLGFSAFRESNRPINQIEKLLEYEGFGEFIRACSYV